MAEGITMPLPLPELRPNPDPTDRTIDQLRREIQMLREIIEQRMQSYDTQLTDRDKAIVLLQSAVDREPKPPVLEAAIRHNADTIDRLGANIEVRFAERDKRIEQRIADNRAAFETALTAGKDAFLTQQTAAQNAINKSEAATLKQMDQIESKFGTEIKAISGNIDDIKTRITTLESLKAGSKEQKEDVKAIWGYVVGAIGILISFITVMFLISNNMTSIREIRTEVVPTTPMQQQQSYVR